MGCCVEAGVEVDHAFETLRDTSDSHTLFGLVLALPVVLILLWLRGWVEASASAVSAIAD